MKFMDLMRETLFSLTANWLRSALTILGIVVGIASVVLMVAIGQGSQASIQQRIESSGSNLITVQPGFGGSSGGVRGQRGAAQTLTPADAVSLQSLQGATAVAQEVSGQYQIVAGQTNTNTRVVGVTANWADVRSTQTSVGAFLSDSDVRSYNDVAVLGPTTASDLFGDNAPLGQTIRINGITFRVIGVTASKGGSGFGNADDAVYVPITTAQQQLAGSTFLTSIDVQASSQDVMSALEQSIGTTLLARHKISDPANADFSVLSQADILQTASTVTGTFTILLASIAGISLLVGGIGIMNMMLTTVTERMREIGLRKALGARQSDISIQFLTEAIALCLSGGVIGIAVSWGASFLVTALAGIATDISLTSVLIAVAVCSAIGLVFGWYPARRAARLDPIEALRYQ